jgi:DNA-binding NarL/FixJ family response regulator
MIRVVLVEDQTLVREGLRHVLALLEDVEVVAEASDGAEALHAVTEARPDVLLLDLRMPRMDGFEVLRQLASRRELPPTLVLTTFGDGDALYQSLRAGARGFLLKDVSRAELHEALRTLAHGGSYIRSGVAHCAVEEVAATTCSFASSVLPTPLSSRERDVLRLMGAGFSNREIADVLALAEGTVKNKASAVLSKLGVRDRTRAVLKAAELGYL